MNLPNQLSWKIFSLFYPSFPQQEISNDNELIASAKMDDGRQIVNESQSILVFD